jgi:FkbM family methyltransferase
MEAPKKKSRVTLPSLPKRLLMRAVRPLGFDIRDAKLWSNDRVVEYVLGDRSNALIFDVGANQGQSIKRFTGLLPSARMHCFEPIPEEYKNLVSNFARPNIRINNIALGAQAGELTLNIALKTGITSINEFASDSPYVALKLAHHKVSTPDQLIAKKVSVPVSTIDAYCATENIAHIDLVKIDTEGFEDEVLAGGQRMIQSRSIDLIEVEVILDNRFTKQLSFYDIEKHMIPHGYRLVGFDDHFNFVNRKVGHVNMIYSRAEIFDELLA